MLRTRIGWLWPLTLLLLMKLSAIGAETVRLSAVSLAWSDEGRTLKAVQAKLDEAATERPDLVLLPQECVATEGEPIPGPISEALGQKSRQHRMYVVGNLRERTWAKRKVRVTAIEGHLGIEELLARLDEAGRMGTDIACTYELVWIGGSDPKQIAADTVTAKKNLLRIADKARQHRMYVLIAGVVDRIERNETILFGRDGREASRYFKIAKTHDQMIPGDAAPILETDFGRIGVRICADEWIMELDRCYAVQGADIVFTPTQSWGPDALFRDLRDISRTMDGLYYLVECTHPSTEATHRSLIVDPAGTVIARSEYRKPSVLTP